MLPSRETDNVYIMQFKKKFPQHHLFSGRRALARTEQREMGDRRNGDIGWEEGWWTTAGVVSWSPKGMHFVISLFQQGWGWYSLLFFCHARESPAPGPLHWLSFYLDLFLYLILVFAPKRSCQWKPPLTAPLGTTILSPAVTLPSPCSPVPCSA